jgi:hypothetical protein
VLSFPYLLPDHASGEDVQVSHPLHKGTLGEKKAKEREEKRQRGHRSSSFGDVPLYHSNPVLAQSLRMSIACFEVFIYSL